MNPAPWRVCWNCPNCVRQHAAVTKTSFIVILACHVNKMPFTFTLPNTKKKLATNIRAKKAAENVAVVGLSTDEPENEMQIIEVYE